MPENQRRKVCFVILGRGKKRWSGSWKHARTLFADRPPYMVLNLDSVTSGDHLRMIPSNVLKQDRRRLTALYRACGYFGKKDLLVHEKGIPWDCRENAGFPYSIRIAAVKPTRTGIRKADQTGAVDITNVNILRAALTTFICCDEAN